MTIQPMHLDRLQAENVALRQLVERLKEREAKMTRCISTMLNTPAQSVASAKYTDGCWEVVMSDGHVWRRVEKFIGNEHESRWFEEWVPRPAVPGSRAAIAEQMEEQADAVLPLHVLGRIAS